MVQKRHLILLVDDNPDVRKLMALILQDEGYTIDQAGNGQEAWRRLIALRRPALIITDLGMPVMSGWQLCARVEADPVLALIPLVVVSGEDAQSLAALRVTAFMQKPVVVDALLLLIARLLPPPPPVASLGPPRARGPFLLSCGDRPHDATV